MNKKKWMLLLLALGLTQDLPIVVAAPFAQGIPCLRFTSQMAPGVAQAGEYKVIHSYQVKCGTSLHNLTVRTQRGALQPVTVERDQGGGWAVVAKDAHDPTVNWGSGSFRVILDNRKGTTPIAYRGHFSLPL
ncbi:hypothetical protein [Pseudomonas sp. NPDC088444]|uniref:hypothetical protein n=1 Tax=Pseudomonas sp. NPDC088444 TaxID=3364456 RepID=UPI00384CE763